MVRSSGLLDKLPPGKRILADGGFAGEPAKIAIPFRLAVARRDAAKRSWNRRVSRQRWRVEAAFSRLKRWRVLSECYRHDLRRHKLLWTLVVHLYNLDVLRHPLSC